MLVPIGLLVVDWPVSPANVKVKERSLAEHGLLQPIAVWMQPDGKMRIIDGLNRVQAAKNLDWKSIEVVTVECSEDAFYDARIQSARQHEDVADERLAEWIAECWKGTHWYKPDDKDVTESIAAAVWQVEERNNVNRRQKDKRLKGHFTDKEIAVMAQWFEGRAEMWLLPIKQIKNALFGKLHWLQDDEADKMMQVDGIPITKRPEVIEKMPPGTKEERRKHVRKFRKSETEPGDWRDEGDKASQENEARKERERKRLERQVEAEKRRSESKESKELQHKKQLERVRVGLMDIIDGLDGYFDRHQKELVQIEEGPEMMAAHIYQARRLTQEVWPKADLRRLLENLASQETVGKKLPGVMATPGEE